MMHVVQFVIFGFMADKLYWRNIKKESVLVIFQRQSEEKSPE